MEVILENNSGILVKKSKFFIYRALIYFSFLLIPVWIQKSLDISEGMKICVMILYILFMVGQWFLLGKEVDHRLKIYFKVNSSLDPDGEHLILKRYSHIGFAVDTEAGLLVPVIREVCGKHRHKMEKEAT